MSKLHIILKMCFYPILKPIAGLFKFKIVRKTEYFPKLSVKVHCTGGKYLSIERTKKREFKAKLLNGLSKQNGRLEQSLFDVQSYKNEDIAFHLAIITHFHLHNNIKSLDNYLKWAESSQRLSAIKQLFNLLLDSQKSYIKNLPPYPIEGESIGAKLDQYVEIISK